MPATNTAVPTIEIRAVVENATNHLAASVLREQRRWLASIGRDVTSRGPAAELEYGSPAAFYRPPMGRLLVALIHDRPGAAGVIGLRRTGPDSAEIRRMFVRPAARGLGVGPALLDAAIASSVELGVPHLHLESVPGLMDAAIAMYRRAGFVITGSRRVDGFAHPFVQMELAGTSTP